MNTKYRALSWYLFMGCWTLSAQDEDHARVRAVIHKHGWFWCATFADETESPSFWWLKNAKQLCLEKDKAVDPSIGNIVYPRYIKCKGCRDYPLCLRRFGAGRINYEVERDGRYYDCPIMQEQATHD